MSRADIQNVCVFCSASERVKERYAPLIKDLVALFEKRGWNLVYGGSSVGIMGALAESAVAKGVKVRGVIPEFLKAMEPAHGGLSELYITQDMHERQMKMAQLSQAFIVLPGGLGTLAEFFEIVTWRLLGLHEKPIIVLNADGYWDSLLQMLDKAESEGFMHGPHRDFVHVVTDVSAIAEIL